MIVFAGVTVAAAAFFLAVVRPRNRPGAPDVVSSGFAPLLRDRQIRLLLVLSFLGLGVFNGLTTWLEPIVLPLGIDAEHAVELRERKQDAVGERQRPARKAGSRAPRDDRGVGVP